MNRKGNFDKFRMAQWLLLSIVAYGIASLLAGMHGDTDAGLYPRVQTILWKCGHLNLAAWLGYVIDRTAFKELRITRSSHPNEQIRRAIIIGATMLAFGMAL